MACSVPTLDGIIELGIRADEIVADEDARRDTRMGGDQAPDEREHWIAGMSGAEQDFIIWIVEMER
jgi:hypothetical protein